MKYFNLFFISIILLILIRCGSMLKKGTPLSEKDRLFRSKCSVCHRLPDPKSRNSDQWLQILDRHKNRIRLNEAELGIIRNYLTGKTSYLNTNDINE